MWLHFHQTQVNPFDLHLFGIILALSWSSWAAEAVFMQIRRCQCNFRSCFSMKLHLHSCRIWALLIQTQFSFPILKTSVFLVSWFVPLLHRHRFFMWSLFECSGQWTIPQRDFEHNQSHIFCHVNRNIRVQSGIFYMLCSKTLLYIYTHDTWVSWTISEATSQHW